MSNSNNNGSGTSMSVKDYFLSSNVESTFKRILGERANAFISSVLQVVSSNNLLKNASKDSIYKAAAMAATLDLPIQSSLGHSYIVPYKGHAQFQVGYKGFIQLAQRSGQYKNISVAVVYEGQLVEDNPLEGAVFDWGSKTSDKVIGYAAHFELLNGFKKTVYSSKDQIEKHAKQYSESYRSGRNTPWKDNFDSMAQKTVIKHLLSKFGPLSIEMQKAVISDQSTINDIESVDVSYPDNPQGSDDYVDAQVEGVEDSRAKALIADCKSVEEIDELNKNEWAKSYAGVISSKRIELLLEAKKCK